MVGSTLGVYSFGLIFVSARTNKRHHHHHHSPHALQTPLKSYASSIPWAIFIFKLPQEVSSSASSIPWAIWKMMMPFICSYRNKNEPTAIYPSLGTPQDVCFLQKQKRAYGHIPILGYSRVLVGLVKEFRPTLQPEAEFWGSEEGRHLMDDVFSIRDTRAYFRKRTPLGAPDPDGCRGREHVSPFFLNDDAEAQYRIIKHLLVTYAKCDFHQDYLHEHTVGPVCLPQERSHQDPP
jgi:hypothetical protein